ncbi:metallophosphoesterase [uncultured Dokdonia sp.]|uniref:metallophosphoesterase n=1 Tax=uncultured Dokdonia sp. TaxID=575653 RepID=UPI002619105C|nr:metallophosphoesterase [uncultured Dokdonia sp.]
MFIQICSDLHLEFIQNRTWIKDHPLVPKGDILVIAGDTFYIDEKLGALDFIKKVSDDFEAVYIVPGNHEYYGGYNIATALQTTHESISKNVFLVNNYSETINGVHFVFSTLWSRIQKNILAIMRGMTDFRKIQFNKEKFTINHFNEIHDACFEFIKREVKKEGKKIVVTHHLPSNLCNVNEFKDSVLNDAFCVDKTNFILNSTIDYWVYGHSHRNLKDFKIGNTQMITNQLGYIGKMEHSRFNLEKVIEL